MVTEFINEGAVKILITHYLSKFSVQSNSGRTMLFFSTLVLSLKMEILRIS